MQIEIKTKDLSATTLQAQLDEVWSAIQADPDLRERALATEFPAEGLQGENPYRATARDEGFGVLDLILIAATGRVVGGVAERLLMKLFDDVVWPRVSARLGGSVERREDER